MPVAYWLSGDLKELMTDMLSQSFVNRQNLFDHSYIQQLTNEHFQHHKDNRKLLWTLLMFQLWYQSYIDKR
jgi:asparagine synthase (glutamine-hydrolysing)